MATSRTMPAVRANRAPCPLCSIRCKPDLTPRFSVTRFHGRQPGRPTAETSTDRRDAIRPIETPPGTPSRLGGGAGRRNEHRHAPCRPVSVDESRRGTRPTPAEGTARSGFPHRGRPKPVFSSYVPPPADAPPAATWCTLGELLDDLRAERRADRRGCGWSRDPRRRRCVGYHGRYPGAQPGNKSPGKYSRWQTSTFGERAAGQFQARNNDTHRSPKDGGLR